MSKSLNRKPLNKEMGYKRKKSFWAIFYAIYISIILLSMNALLAQYTVDDIVTNMDIKYDYKLIFTHDGKTTHYDVVRYDSNDVGKITLTYWTDSNTLEIHEVLNIKSLKIDVQSMFEDESIKVFRRSHDTVENLDMLYWLEANGGIFTVVFDIDLEEPLQSLIFTKFPEPSSVTVNNQEWWKTQLNYSINGEEISVTNIPTGDTTVILYFNLPNELPVPMFTMKPDKKAGVNEEIWFNASGSYDPDGEIISWLWEFGDSAKDSGKTVKYQYPNPGIYTIRLTVRDNAEPYGLSWLEKNITIEYGAEVDTDKDGLRDWWEWKYFQSLEHGPNDDPDSDGYPNGLEILAGTNPNDGSEFAEDSDGDVLPDFWEWTYFQTLSEGPFGDPDNDKATNKEELIANTSPVDENEKPKPAKKDDDQKPGIFGLGADLDMIIIIVILIVIILLVVMVVVFSKRKKSKKVPLPPKEQVSETPADYSSTTTTTQQTMQTTPSTPAALTTPPARPITPTTATQTTFASTVPTQTLPIQAAQTTSSYAQQVSPPPAAQQFTGVQAPAAEFMPTTSNHLPVKGPPKKQTEPGQEELIDESLQNPQPTFEQPVEQEFDSNIPAEFEEPITEVPDEMVPEPVTEEELELSSKIKVRPTNVKLPVSNQMLSKPTEPTREEIIEQYSTIFNIDVVKAGNLYEAGFIKLDYLKFAALEELAAIDGIGPETALSIKDQLERMENLGNQNKTSATNGGSDLEEDLDIPGEELLQRVTKFREKINNINKK